MSRRAIAVAALSLSLAGPIWAEDITRHGVSTFGDLKYPADFGHFDYVNPDAPKGGAYSSTGTLASGTFDSLNPYILKGEVAQGVGDPNFRGGFTHDNLMVRAHDEPDAVYGLIAESVTLPEDRSWAIFTLREAARFSDGTPVRAEDVKFSLDIIKEKGSPRYAISLDDIASAEVLSPLEVKFTFDEDAPKRALPMVAAGLPILSKAFYETRDFAESTLEPPLGSGPYAVGRVQPGRSIEFIRRDDYWAKDLPVNVGRWNFDTITYEYFKDRTAAFEAFKAGEYLFHEEFFSKLWATAYDFPAIEKGWVKRETLPDGRVAGTQGYFLNLRREKFADPRVREAIGLGFDFEWSNETLFYGLYERTNSFWEGSTMEASGPPTEEEALLIEAVAPGAVDLTQPAYEPPVTDGAGRIRANLRKAGALLDAAGWTIRDGVRKNAAGETLKIEFVDDSPAFERITGPFIENLKRMGIDASQRTLDQAQFQQRLEEFDFDITVSRLALSPTAGPGLRALFGSVSANQNGTLNLAGLASPDVDALLEAAIEAETRDEMEVAIRAADRVMRSMHIWVPQWTKTSHTVAYWDRYGQPDAKPPYDRAVIDTWWEDADKAAALDAARAE